MGLEHIYIEISITKAVFSVTSNTMTIYIQNEKTVHILLDGRSIRTRHLLIAKNEHTMSDGNAHFFVLQYNIGRIKRKINYTIGFF